MIEPGTKVRTPDGQRTGTVIAAETRRALGLGDPNEGTVFVLWNRVDGDQFDLHIHEEAEADLVFDGPSIVPDGDVMVQCLQVQVADDAPDHDRHRAAIHNDTLERFIDGLPPLHPGDAAVLHMVDALRRFVEEFGLDPYNLEYVIEPMKNAIDCTLSLAGVERLDRTRVSSYLIDLTGLGR